MARKLQPGEDAAAFVAQSRPYPASAVLPALVRSHMTVTERTIGPGILELLRHVQPDILIAAIEPTNEADLQFVRGAARRDCLLLVIAPVFDAEAITDALRAGADVWLTDADCEQLFEAQIGAIRRRLELPAPRSIGEGDVLVSGPLRLDLRSYRVTLDDTFVPLTTLEFRILAQMVRNEGSVLSPVELLTELQAFEYTEAQARDLMKVHIRRIRSKLAAVRPGAELISNVRGIGYLFERADADGTHGRSRLRRVAT